MFRASPTTGGLELLGSTPSGGGLPASVDEHRSRLYVLNSGSSPNVAAFDVGADGTLTPIASLETLALDATGAPGTPVTTMSGGAVPFGFAITRHDVVVVSEAGNSTVSSYALGIGGALTTITASAPVGQGAGISTRSPQATRPPAGASRVTASPRTARLPGSRRPTPSRASPGAAAG